MSIFPTFRPVTNASEEGVLAGPEEKFRIENKSVSVLWLMEPDL